MNDKDDRVEKLEFAELIIEGLKNAGDDRVVNYEEESFRLTFHEDGKDCGVLNLANLHHEFSNLDADGREQRISEIVRASLSHLKPIPDDFGDASYDLRPRLWARSTFETMKLRSRLEGTEGPDWPLESVGEHLYLSLVFDLPESVRSLSDDELKNWGVSYWEAREVAVANLAEEEFKIASLGDKLYATNTCDSYDATRIVLPLAEQLSVEGDPVAMVPNRDTLLITGSESEAGLTMMVEFAVKELMENPRPLIATPLIFRDGQWEDWDFPLEHPSHEEYRRCMLGWRQFEYDTQKNLLESIHENELTEEFLASYTVIAQDDRHLSYCVWGEGVVSSLPKTDRVAFMGAHEEEISAFATWAQVEELCGSLMIQQEHYPVRYRVEEFPTPEILSQLGGLS